MTASPIMDREGFIAVYGNLSDERLARLDTYVALLKKWNKAINLVGPKTLADTWRRHILDSAQLVALLGAPQTITDLGSGAGLPGLIIAALTDAKVTLIESDQRKSTFMREAARAMEIPVTVISKRIEEVEAQNADIVTARALAPLPKLLPWVARHLKKDGKAVLLKGADADQELTLAGKNWTMDTKKTGSLTDPSARILTLTKLARRADG